MSGCSSGNVLEIVKYLKTIERDQNIQFFGYAPFKTLFDVGFIRPGSSLVRITKVDISEGDYCYRVVGNGRLEAVQECKTYAGDSGIHKPEEILEKNGKKLEWDLACLNIFRDSYSEKLEKLINN